MHTVLRDRTPPIRPPHRVESACSLAFALTEMSLEIVPVVCRSGSLDFCRSTLRFPSSGTGEPEWWQDKAFILCLMSGCDFVLVPFAAAVDTCRVIAAV